MSPSKRKIAKRPAPRPGPTPHEPFVPPYPPSWLNRLESRVERLPGPFWLPYVLAAAVLFVTVAVLSRPEAAASPRIDPVRALLSLAAVGLLLFMHGLDRLAAHSFDASRSILRATGSEAEALRYCLVTLPARPAAAAGLLGTGVGLTLVVIPAAATTVWGVELGPVFTQVLGVLGGFRLAGTPVKFALEAALLTLTWWVSGALVYHTLRQLGWVSRIYTEHIRVDLLKPGPLYRLSRVTAGTSLGLVLLIYLFYATDPVFFFNAINLGVAGFIAFVAIAAFLLPLLGIHRILAAEKEHLLEETADRLKRTLAELHRRVDQVELGQMDALNKAIASLETERNLVSRIPTWPWQPEALRTLIGALLLPLILWLTQVLLGPILSP